MTSKDLTAKDVAAGFRTCDVHGPHYDYASCPECEALYYEAIEDGYPPTLELPPVCNGCDALDPFVNKNEAGYCRTCYASTDAPALFDYNGETLTEDEWLDTFYMAARDCGVRSDTEAWAEAEAEFKRLCRPA